MPPRLVGFTYNTLCRPKPLRWIVDRAVMLFIPASITIPEGTVSLDRRDAAVSGTLALGIHDPFEIDLFRKSVGQGMTVIDIGANLGYYTVIAAGRVGPRGRVFAYEPEEKNFALLGENIRSNNFSWAIGLRTALSDMPGNRTLFVANRHTGIHSFANNRNSTRKIDIPTDTLDNSLEQHGSPAVDIIKMDIEGAEILALDGMRRTIARSRKIIVFSEFYPQAIMRLGRKPIELLKGLQTLGFSLSVIDENNKRLNPLPPDKFEAFIVSIPPRGEMIRNLYAIKNA